MAPDDGTNDYEDYFEWYGSIRKFRNIQIRKYLNPNVHNTTTESPSLDDETCTVYEFENYGVCAQPPENRHERRKADAIARKNSKPRSQHENNRSNRKSRKW